MLSGGGCRDEDELLVVKERKAHKVGYMGE